MREVQKIEGMLDAFKENMFLAPMKKRYEAKNNLEEYVAEEMQVLEDHQKELLRQLEESQNYIKKIREGKQRILYALSNYNPLARSFVLFITRCKRAIKYWLHFTSLRKGMLLLVEESDRIEHNYLERSRAMSSTNHYFEVIASEFDGQSIIDNAKRCAALANDCMRLHLQLAGIVRQVTQYQRIIIRAYYNELDSVPSD